MTEDAAERSKSCISLCMWAR